MIIRTKGENILNDKIYTHIDNFDDEFEISINKITTNNSKYKELKTKVELIREYILKTYTI